MGKQKVEQSLKLFKDQLTVKTEEYNDASQKLTEVSEKYKEL